MGPHYVTMSALSELVGPICMTGQQSPARVLLSRSSNGRPFLVSLLVTDKHRLPAKEQITLFNTTESNLCFRS